MGYCEFHPDRQTPFLCMKHERYLCESCLACFDPHIYCKHRPACPIWVVHKEKQREMRRPVQAAGEDAADIPPN